MDKQRLDELSARHLDGAISEPDARELAEWLQGHPEELPAWIEQLALDRLLKEAGRKPLDVARLLKALPADRFGSRVMKSLAQSKPPDAQPARPVPAGDVKFWFCETCGKRLTDQELAAGAGRDKKLKGVYCAECAVGVLTVETLPVTSAQARALLEAEKRVERAETRKTEVRPGMAGDGVSAVQRTSSKRITAQAARRVRGRVGERSFSPFLPALAAGVALVVILALAFPRRTAVPSVSQAEKAEKTRREDAEKSKAQEQLARQEEAVRKATAEAGRAVAERKAAEERLEALHAEQERLAEAQRKPEQDQTAGALEARRQELAALEARRKAEEEKLAQTAEAQRQAEAELAKVEQSREEAEQKVAVALKLAEELGRIVFVAELKDGEKSRLVLVRAGERQALAKGMKVRKGDLIECGLAAALPVRVRWGLFSEFTSGATVDMADATTLEVLDAETLRLERGLLYADVSAAAASGQAARGKRVFRTAHADVEVEAASFDLRADAKEAVLQVEEGASVFKNAQGETRLEKEQKALARAGFAPAAGGAVKSGEIWRGRKGTGGPAAKPASLPVQGLSYYVRADAGVIRDGANRVQRWLDQAGSGRDAAQSAANSQPLWVEKALNGKPVLRFDGVDDFLRTSFVPAMGAAPRTAIAVLAQVPPKSSTRALAFHYGDPRNDECYGLNTGIGGFGNYYYGTALNGAQKPTAAPEIVTLRYDGAEDRVFVNGVEKGVKQIVLKTGSGGMRIGCKVTDGNYPFKGDLAEILIYDRALPDAERQAVEAYLNAKYAVMKAP